MRVFFILLIGLTLPLTSALAGFHDKYFAHELDPAGLEFAKASSKEPEAGKLIISGQLDHDLSSTYFGVVNVVLENRSDQWIQVKDLSLSFPQAAQNKNISVVGGNMFKAWSVADQHRRDYNSKRNTLIAGLIGGALAASSKDDQKLRNLGAGLALGAVAVSATKGKNFKKLKATLPSTHLLSGDIVVPPGLFIKKWIVFNSKDHKKMGYVDVMSLNFKEGKKKVTTHLRLRKSGGATWQSDLPALERKGPSKYLH